VIDDAVRKAVRVTAYCPSKLTTMIGQLPGFIFGMMTVSSVADFETTVARFPPKETCSPARTPVASAVTSVPSTVTVAPFGPMSGEKPR
jgi:hypothetical protein